MDRDADYCVRKSRLRYSQPPSPPSSDQYYASTLPTVLPPMVVQSARTSPRGAHMQSMPTLPHFHEWTRPELATAKPHYSPHTSYPHPPPGNASVPPAPFANAGPPGVHFYSTSVSDRMPPRGRQRY